MTTAPGIVVAVLDSGVDSTHRDFIVGSTSLVTGDAPTGDGDSAHYWHGTAVAGIIAERLREATRTTPAASIRSYRITDEQGAIVEGRIVAAMTAAMAHGAQVINLSASWSHCSASLRQALLLAKPGAITASGALVVVTSPGYLLHTEDQYPGVYADSDEFEFLVAVAGFGMKRLRPALLEHRACTSPLASKIPWDSRHPDNGYAPRMLAAPGEDICTTLPGNRYGRVRGDSFAAPYVTALAAAALLQPAYRHATAGELRRLLFDAACEAPAALRNLAGGAGIHCVASARFIERLNSSAEESRYDA